MPSTSLTPNCRQVKRFSWTLGRTKTISVLILKNGMGMRPVLVAAVCSAGAAFVLILTELAAVGAPPHIGGNTNHSAPVTKNPSQLASGGSDVHGTLRPGPIPTDGDGQTQPDEQPTAEAPPSGGDRQPTLAGAVQQALSNNPVPIPIGPPGR
jgi:hypothetical protein